MLHFIEENIEKDKVIIFLHPKNLSNWVWRKQFNNFNDFHCIYLDLPNHGNSYYNKDFTIPNTVEILKEYIQSLKKNEINLIGIDLGGQIAIEFICKYPRLINKIIVSGVECVSKIDISFFNLLNKENEFLFNKKPGFLTKAYLRFYGISNEFYDDVFKSCENPNYNNLKKISYESLNYSLNLKLKDKSKEILILFAEYDTIWVKLSSIAIKNIYKNSKILEIKKTTHLLNIRSFREFNKIAIDYLRN